MASRKSTARRRAVFFGAAAAVVMLDQAAKAAVRSSMEIGEKWPDWDLPFRIRYVTNSGAAFGILQDQTAFLVIMACVGLAAIYLYYRNPPFDHWIAPAAIGMMLGGAIGNLIDRVRLGEVTDFVDFDRFPAFNVADAAINVGVAAVIIGYLLWGDKGSEPRKDSPGAAKAGQQAGSPGQEPDAGTPADR
jgi:signal peptidase II